MLVVIVSPLIFLLSFQVHCVSCPVLPKFVRGVNDIWSTVKESVNEALDCITLSRPPTVSDVRFYLFTPKTRTIAEEIKDLQINKSQNFNMEFFTKVLIHGYTQSYKNEHFIRMKDVYVSSGNFNVIMVNWENLAFSPCYPIAADYAAFVGQLTGYLLEKLEVEKVHIIGFSLGAHVAGIGAQMLTNTRKIMRITGLDPAGPMFLNNPVGSRLDAGDATNVDVIHTSHAGLAGSSGHADFFVNGGKTQPGCSSTDVPCSHRRSLELYLESITSNVTFKAISCDSLNNFESNKCANNTYTSMAVPREESFFLKPTRHIRTHFERSKIPPTQPMQINVQKSVSNIIIINITHVLKCKGDRLINGASAEFRETWTNFPKIDFGALINNLT